MGEFNGLSIVQGVYAGLRKPAETALPYKTILRSVRDVVARKKFDLALSPHNSLGTMSEWFTPSSADFPIEELGFEGVMLPVRLESRSVGSALETGEEVPIVSYDVLNTSINGAVSFYGSPIRMSFRDPLEYLTGRQYRLLYESDFSDQLELTDQVALPSYVSKMIEVEAKYDLVDLVEDESPEWANFVQSVTGKWASQIEDWRSAWDRYVRSARGKHQTPKRTFWHSRGHASKTRYFRG